MILGIDPGKSGGISVVSKYAAHAFPMPETEKDTYDLLRDLIEGYEIKKCYLEKVASRPGQSSVATFTFGKGYGFLRGCLVALGVSFEDISPQKWQKTLNCQTKGDKNVTKSKAQQLYPNIKITHKVADAILIGRYGYERESSIGI